MDRYNEELFKLKIKMSYNEELCDASRAGKLSAVQYSIQKGAAIHAQNDRALEAAARRGHLSIVQYLVDHGAYIHARDNEALKAASLNGHLPVVEYLLDKGAKF